MYLLGGGWGTQFSPQPQWTEDEKSEPCFIMAVHDLPPRTPPALLTHGGLAPRRREGNPKQQAWQLSSTVRG